MTRDDAFQEYEKTLDELSKEYNKALAKAKATLHEELRIIREGR